MKKILDRIGGLLFALFIVLCLIGLAVGLARGQDVENPGSQAFHGSGSESESHTTIE